MQEKSIYFFLNIPPPYCTMVEVVEFLRETGEVTHPVSVLVEESTDVDFVYDRVFVPERVGRELDVF